MDKRRFLPQLPAVHQTETLKKFFGSTVDHTFQPGRAEQISGYIGQRPPYFDATKDFYVPEPTATRRAYQLDPAMASRNANGEITHLNFYEDLINYLKAANAITNNHNRLFSDTYYAWAPPVDIDKLQNHQQYMWFGDAPYLIPALTLTAKHADYMADGTVFEFDLPPVQNFTPTHRETPLVYVDFLPVEVERVQGNTDRIALVNVPPAGAKVTVFRYADLSVVMAGLVQFDPSGFIEEGASPTEVTKLTSNMRLRFEDGLAFYNGWDRKPWEKIVRPALEDCHDEYDVISRNYLRDVPWDVNERRTTTSFWVEGVGSDIEIVPFYEALAGRDAKPIHVTIDRRSRDRNPWSRDNFWVHVDSFAWSQQRFADRAAERPIVEFLPNLQLSNYGTRWLGEIDGVLTGNPVLLPLDLDPHVDIYGDLTDLDIQPVDTLPLESSAFAPFPLRNLQGQPMGRVYVDGRHRVVYGDKILVRANADEQLRNRILTVDKGIDTVIEVQDDGSELEVQIEVLVFQVSPAPRKGDIVRLAVRGWVPWDNREGHDVLPWVYDPNPVEFWFNGDEWIAGQRRNYEDSDPLFALYTKDQVAHDDLENSTFAGNRLFGFARGEGRYDTVLDRQLRYTATNANSGRSEIIFENDQVTRRATSNGETIKGYQFYRINGRTEAQDVYSPSWHATTEISRQMLDNNVFTTPMNLSANPDMEEVSFIAKNEWFDHFAALETRQTGFEGTAYARNNWRDTPRTIGQGYTGLPWKAFTVYRVGDTVAFEGNFYRCLKNHTSGAGWTAPASFSESDKKFAWCPHDDEGMPLWEMKPMPQIIQHRSPLLKTMLLAADKRFDFTDAARYVDQEYQRFRMKFFGQITEVLNDGERLESDDDELWIDTILTKLRVAKTMEFPFALSNMAGGRFFIPPTAAALGLLPVHVPQFETDDTYTPSVLMLRGHDGSRLPFTEITLQARILLALERRIWRNISSEFKTEAKPDFDFYDILESRARIGFTGNQVTRGDPNPCDNLDEEIETERTTYSQEEYVQIYTPLFMRWAQLNQYDYRTHGDFSESDPFTWNYRSVKDIDGNPCFGNWRALYRWFFDTDRPHAAPWEMLGFTNRPSWWERNYGPAPYTSGNTVLWEDIRDGRIKGGPRAGIDTRFRRPDLFSILPVDEDGKLLDPMKAGIVPVAPISTEANKPWMIGDQGPVENLWMNSASYPFAKSILGFLMRPAAWVEVGWDRGNRRTLADTQWYNLFSENRPRSAELRIHGEVIEGTNGDRYVRYGLQQWISDLMRSRAQDAEIFGNAIRGLECRLSHKMAGFTQANNLRIFADNFGLVPEEDIEVRLHRSPPFREAVYSGVLVEWTGDGWKVIGYDTVKEGFCVLTEIDRDGEDDQNDGSKTRTISLGEEPPVYEWVPGRYYPMNVLIDYRGSVYRAIRAHTSNINFEDEYWSATGSSPNRFPKISIYERNANWSIPGWSSENLRYKYVPYGTVFKTLQDLGQFLWDWGLTLENMGFVFDYVDPVSGEIQDWEFAIRQFLSWAQMDWQPGNFIALSPGASQLKFIANHGTVYNIEETSNGLYGLIDRTGRPIPRRLTFVSRLDEETKIICVSDDLYGARLRVGEIEHVIVFSPITIFNDVIYRPLYNLRQPRLRIIGLRSGQWKGRQDAPGYIVDGDNLLPSFDRSAENIRTMFEIETSEDRILRDHARHVIGYETRPYMNSLLFSETEQFEFYQGMIQAKGTPGVFQKLTRSRIIDETRDLKFLEEWALHLSRFGAIDKRSMISFKLDKTDIRNNPQLITFGEDDPFDHVLGILQDSNRWIERPATPNVFPTVKPEPVQQGIGSVQTQVNREFLPTAGPVRVDEIHMTAMYPHLLGQLWEEASDTTNAIRLGTRIWIYDMAEEFRTWNVLQTYYLSNEDSLRLLRIDGADQDEDLAKACRLVFSAPHGLTAADEGEYILISDNFSQASSEWNGIHRLFHVESPTTLVLDVYVSDGPDFTSRVSPDVFIFRTLRFETNVERDAHFARYAPDADQLAWVTNPTGNGEWKVYRFVNNAWTVYREQPKKIDSRRLTASLIYAEKTAITDEQIQPEPLRMDGISVIDPLVGLIAGDAERELTWKMEYNPAQYEGPNRWGAQQVGQLWWNLSSVYFMEPESDILVTHDPDRRLRELDHRVRFWTRSAPGSTFEVYEWTRSITIPTDQDLIGTIYSYGYFSWIANEEFDRAVNKKVTAYYFWKLNPNTVPNAAGRRISALRVADLLQNPKAQDLPYVAAVADHAIIVSGIEQHLQDENTVLQFDLTEDEYEGAIHNEWKLVRVNDDRTIPPNNVWRAVRNSLVGLDDFQNLVPDPSLHERDRVGLTLRPRRSLIAEGREGIINARRSFIDMLNRIFNRSNLMTERPEIARLLTLETPTYGDLIWRQPEGETDIKMPPVNSYDFEVASMEERDWLLNSIQFLDARGYQPWDRFEWDTSGWDQDQLNVERRVMARNPRILVTNYEAERPSWSIWELDVSAPVRIDNPAQYLRLASQYDVEVATYADAIEHLMTSARTIGQRILVRNDENANGFWTLWRFHPSDLHSNEQGLVFENAQTYRTTDFWTVIDWYQEGYSLLNAPIVSYATIEARNNAEMPNPSNEFVRVMNDGTGAWIWTVYDGTNWNVVARQGGTIRFSDDFYDASRVVYGRGVPNTRQIANRDGTLEFQVIMDQLKNHILSNIQVNELFFSLLHFIHTQQDQVSWAFKTSFLSIVGFNEQLRQTPVQVFDTTDNLITFIEEVKPYRVKVRDFSRMLTPPLEMAYTHVSDFDKPLYFDTDRNQWRRLDPFNTDDMLILQTRYPWRDWAEHFQLENLNPSSPNYNPVRRMNITMRFDRVDWGDFPLDSGMGYDLGPNDMLGWDADRGLAIHAGSAHARLLAFYEPRLGMWEKNLNLHLGLGFKGTIVDGGDLFWPIDEQYSDWSVKGWDTMEWDSTLTAERDNTVDGLQMGQKIEVNMNPNDPFKHHELVDPYHNPDHPQELARVQGNVALAMTVHQGWVCGAPNHFIAHLDTKRLRRNTVKLSYAHIASSTDAVMVFRDGVRAVEGTDYTIDHFKREVSVQVGSPKAKMIMVHVLGPAGLVKIAEQRYYAGTGTERRFALAVTPEGVVDVVVDGIRTAAYTIEGNEIVFTTAPVAGADILITVYVNKPWDYQTPYGTGYDMEALATVGWDTDESLAEADLPVLPHPATHVVRTVLDYQEDRSWALVNRTLMRPNEAIGTIVEVNGLRLDPPFTSYGEFSAESRFIPLRRVNNIENVTVWLDGYAFMGTVSHVGSGNSEFEPDYMDPEITDGGLDMYPLDTTLLDVAGQIAVVDDHLFANDPTLRADRVIAMVRENHDFEINEGVLIVRRELRLSDWDTNAQGWDDFGWDQNTYVPGDLRIETTTFENSKTMGIETHTYQGSSNGVYILPSHVPSEAALLVSVNGRYVTCGVDYALSTEVVGYDEVEMDHVGFGYDKSTRYTVITLPGGQEPHDRIVVTAFTGAPLKMPETWGALSAKPSATLMGDPVLAVDFDNFPLDTVPLGSSVGLKGRPTGLYEDRQLWRMNNSWEVFAWESWEDAVLAEPVMWADDTIVIKLNPALISNDLYTGTPFTQPDPEQAKPGAVWINGERIEYFGFDDSVPGRVVLSELRRGSRGTRRSTEQRLTSVSNGDGVQIDFALEDALNEVPVEVSLLHEDASLPQTKGIHYEIAYTAQGATVTFVTAPPMNATVRLAQTIGLEHPVGSAVRNVTPNEVAMPTGPFRIKDIGINVDTNPDVRIYL